MHAIATGCVNIINLKHICNIWLKRVEAFKFLLISDYHDSNLVEALIFENKREHISINMCILHYCILKSSIEITSHPIDWWLNWHTWYRYSIKEAILTNSRSIAFLKNRWGFNYLQVSNGPTKITLGNGTQGMKCLHMTTSFHKVRLLIKKLSQKLRILIHTWESRLRPSSPHTCNIRLFITSSGSGLNLNLAHLEARGSMILQTTIYNLVNH